MSAGWWDDIAVLTLTALLIAAVFVTVWRNTS